MLSKSKPFLYGVGVFYCLKIKKMKYRIYNNLWEYEIVVNSNGVVISTNSYPSNREHWSIGFSLDWLKKYYSYDCNRTDIYEIMKVHIQAI